MRNFRFFIMGILLFISPILFRILFDEGDKLEMNTIKTLDKNKNM